MDVREKLVELIGSTEYGKGSLVGNNFQKGFIEKIASNLITNGVTVQEWIPVTERLPEEDTNVIAFCYWHESWSVQVCHLNSNYEGQWYTSVAGQWVRVTHWMPLPEPPKGE